MKVVVVRHEPTGISACKASSTAPATRLVLIASISDTKVSGTARLGS